MNGEPTQLEMYCHQLDICNSAIEDTIVSDRIKGACPPGTYSWIFVRTADHYFGTTLGTEPEPSRLIQFKPTGKEALWNILRIIFQTTDIETININRVVLGLLGSTDERDNHCAHSAYWQNYTIKVYVSMGNPFSVDMQSEQGAVTQRVTGICTLL